MARTTATTASVAARVGGLLHGDAGVALEGATHDSRSVRPGWLFCCVPGEHRDGHDFAPVALGAGAAALLVERRLDVAAPQIEVPDVRTAMAAAAAEVHGDPSTELVVIGVTGTNGKTTVVALLGHILGAAGLAVEVLGTLTGARTTPEATDLQARLAAWRDAGTTHVAMEVSSHALALHRVDEVAFDVAVFTNLGTDHLDFHDGREDYFAAKARLFEPGRARVSVVNVDDVHGRLLRDASAGEVVGFSVDAVDDLRLGPSYSELTWRDGPLRVGLPGRYNVSNALAAAEAAVAVGVDPSEVRRALSAVPAVPGRFEPVDAGQDFAVIVDYAHTPDALEALLEAASELRGPSGRLTVVFGCGGDRDARKRPEMGRAVTSRADVTIVTNDNPRSEDPLRIIEEIRTGCVREPLVEPDRRVAIRLALRAAGSGDVVVIAGKGHEQGQELAERTVPFDDRAVAREELEGRPDATGGARP